MRCNLPISVLVLAFFFVTTANAQSLLMPELYESFNEEHKTALFIEDFSSNGNDWYLGIKEEVWFENLQDSTLYFQSFESTAKEDFKEVIINQEGDFEIELKIRLDKGVANKFFGLQWGKSTTEAKQYDFFFNGQGQYTIDKYTGSFTDYVPAKASRLINNYTYNTLTIRKVSDTYYFFINKEMVHKMPFEPFFGNGIGFQVAGNSSIQIDYLNVWELSTGKSDRMPALAVVNKSNSSPSGAVKAGETVTMKFEFSNSSAFDANNLKLRYTFPSDVMLLESKTELLLKANTSKEVELVFYINKNVETNEIPVTIKVEGARLEEGNAQSFNLALNQTIGSNLPQQNEELAMYRGSNDPLKGLGASKAMEEVSVGKYFALIIGIDKYSGDWKSLRNAVNDAKAVEEQLTSRYEFQSVRTLYNEQATRTNILNEYEWLMTNVGENDNLLIFYSGHGDYNETLQRGFWVPSDATSSSISGLIANTDIQTFLSGIKSKHTFLIADACFSGDIFRGKTLTIPYENSFKYYNKIYSKNSRTALTSGGIEPVMDGGKDGHSVFSYYLLKSLRNNENKFLDGSQLYNDLKVAVINNSNQTPGFSPIVNTGDEGGQFIFIKK